MKKYLLTILFLSTLIFSYSQAAAQNQEDPCEAEENQMNLNLCAFQRYQKADADLNATWKTLLADMDEDAKTEIRIVQKLWLKFRDAHCQYEASFYEGGSIQPLILNSCLRELTEQRTKQLQAQIDNFN